MRNLILSILFFGMTCFAGMWDNDYTFPVALISAPQDITSVWTDVGSPVKITGFQRVALDVDLDINDGVNTRLRWVRQEEASGDDRQFMTETIGAASTAVAPMYYEFSSDADQVVSLDFTIFPVNYIQLQTSAGTEGSTAAQLDAVKYFLIRE